MATEWIFKGTGATKFRTQGAKALAQLKRGGRSASRWLDIPGARIFVRVLPHSNIEQVWIFAKPTDAGVFTYTSRGLTAFGPPYGQFSKGAFKELETDTTDYLRMKQVYEKFVGNSAVPAWVVMGAASAYANAANPMFTPRSYQAIHSAGAGDAYGVIAGFSVSNRLETLSVVAAADIMAAVATSSDVEGTEITLDSAIWGQLTPSIYSTSPYLLGALYGSDNSYTTGDYNFITSLSYSTVYDRQYQFVTYQLGATGELESAHSLPSQTWAKGSAYRNLVVRWDISEFFPPHEVDADSSYQRYSGSHYGVDVRDGSFFVVGSHSEFSLGVSSASLGGVDVTGTSAAYFPTLDLLDTSVSWTFGGEIFGSITTLTTLSGSASGTLTETASGGINTLSESSSFTSGAPVLPASRYRIVGTTYDSGASRTRDVYYVRSTGVQVATLTKDADGVVTALRDEIGLSQTGMDQLMYDRGRAPLVILNL